MKKMLNKGIAKYATTQIMLELNAKPEAICESELYNSIKNKVLNAAIEYKDTDEFYGEIQKILQEKVNELTVFRQEILRNLYQVG